MNPRREGETTLERVDINMHSTHPERTPGNNMSHGSLSSGRAEMDAGASRSGVDGSQYWNAGKKKPLADMNPRSASFLLAERARGEALGLHQCSFWLKRKKRQCSHCVSAPGKEFCSMPEVLDKLRREAIVQQVTKFIVTKICKSFGEDATKGMQKQQKKRKRRSRTSAPKRMVNPFSEHYSAPLLLPAWGKIYKDLMLPLVIDVGCARGLSLIKLAQRDRNRNFLGIEIRPKLVLEACATRDSLGLSNLHFVAANFSPDEARRLLRSLPCLNMLQCVAIQFPDPWRKKKQIRRRVLSASLVKVLVSELPTGCCIYMSSDVQEMANSMVEVLSSNPQLSRLRRHELPSWCAGGQKQGGSGCIKGAADKASNEWESLGSNILGEMTERELVSEQQWRCVYRAVFQCKTAI